jgi:hypothetical protein
LLRQTLDRYLRNIALGAMSGGGYCDRNQDAAARAQRINLRIHTRAERHIHEEEESKV